LLNAYCQRTSIPHPEALPEYSDISQANQVRKWPLDKQNTWTQSAFDLAMTAIYALCKSSLPAVNLWISFEILRSSGAVPSPRGSPSSPRDSGWQVVTDGFRFRIARGGMRASVQNGKSKAETMKASIRLLRSFEPIFLSSPTHNAYITTCRSEAPNAIIAESSP
jgi:hypothetical protein